MFDIPLIIHTYGVIGISLIIFLESCIFPFLPGDSLLFTAGFLASQNIIPIVPLYFGTLTMAILGDSVGYSIGRFFGNRIYESKHPFLKIEHLEKTRIFFQNHGPKSLIIARFVPIVRTFIPLLAGVGKMPYTKFLTYNITGGFLWITSMVLGGYYLSAVFPAATNHIDKIVIAIIIISLLPGVVTYLNEKIKIKKQA